MIDCKWLREQIGWSCQTAEAVSGEAAMAVQTSNRWMDGSPLSFYIIEQGDTLILTDEYETIFHFHAVGLMDKKQSWQTLRDKLNCTNSPISLEDDGEVLSIVNKKNSVTGIADYISALCSIMHYEREILGIPKQIIEFSEEVEFYLKAWKPNAKLKKDVKVKGFSENEHKFDFEIDGRLILAINPSPNAVGAAMRKAGDVTSGSFLDNRRILVVVDDRGNDLFDKAQEEINIISVISEAIPFSNLIQAAEKKRPKSKSSDLH